MGIATMDNFAASVESMLEMSLFREAYCMILGANSIVSNDDWLSFRKEFPIEFYMELLNMSYDM